MGNISILISGYKKGFKQVIYCTSDELAASINNHVVDVPDYRDKLNVIADGQSFYSLGFTEEWKIFSKYMSYAWDARMELISLSIFVDKDYKLKTDEVKELLDALFKQHIKFNDSNLQTILPFTSDTFGNTQYDLSIEKMPVIGIDYVFHREKYDKRRYHIYKDDKFVNKLFDWVYAPEFDEKFREIYLLNSQAKYIKPLEGITEVPVITPQKLTKKITIVFRDRERNQIWDIDWNKVEIGEHQKGESRGIIKVKEKDNNLIVVKVNDERYETYNNTHTTSELLSKAIRDEFAITLIPRVYQLSIICKDNHSKPVPNVEVVYTIKGKESIRNTSRDGRFRIYTIPVTESVDIKSVVYKRTDRKFEQKITFEKFTNESEQEKIIWLTEITRPVQNAYVQPSNAQPVTKPKFNGTKQSSNNYFTFLFDPEDVVFDYSKISLTYSWRNGSDRPIKSNEVAFYPGKLEFELPKEYEMITFKLNDPKYQFESNETEIKLSAQSVKSYNYERKVKLQSKGKKGSPVSGVSVAESVFSWRLLNIVLPLCFLIALGIVGYVYLLPMLRNSGNSEIVEAKKLELNGKVEMVKTKFYNKKDKAEKEINPLINELKAKFEKNEKLAPLDNFSNLMNKEKLEFDSILNNINDKIKNLEEIKDTTSIVGDIKNCRFLDNRINTIRENAFNAHAEYKSGKNEEKAIAIARVESEFKRYRDYMYGSLNNNDKVVKYLDALKGKTNRRKFLNAGINKTVYNNTLSLAWKRKEIKEYRFIVGCFAKVVPCSNKASFSDYKKALAELEKWKNDKNALTEKQRKDITDFLTECNITS